MTINFKNLLDSLNAILKPVQQIIALFAIITNLYVICMLITTDKFNIKLNDININGNFAIAIALTLVLIVIINLTYKSDNLVLNIISKMFSVSTAIYIYKECFGKFNANDGLIMQNKFFAVYHNFTLIEKQAWISKLELELNTQLEEISAENLNQFHSYNEFKLAIMQHMEEVKRLQEIAKNSTKDTSGYLSASLDWISTHKLLFASVVIIATVGVFLYVNNYTIADLYKLTKKGAEHLEKTAELQENTQAQVVEIQTNLNKLRLLLHQHLQNHHVSQNTVDVEYIEGHIRRLEGVLEDFNQMTTAKMQTLESSLRLSEESNKILKETLTEVTTELDVMKKFLETNTNNTSLGASEITRGEIYAMIDRKIQASENNITNLYKSTLLVQSEHEIKLEILKKGQETLDNNARLMGSIFRNDIESLKVKTGAKAMYDSATEAATNNGIL